MAQISLQDIRLVDLDLNRVGLLQRLRQKNLAAETAVCVERARYVTEYLRDLSTDAEPMELRYAKAVRHFLSNKATFFPDENLLAGTTTSKYYGAPVYPELTGLTIWPELDTISLRENNPQKLHREDADELNLEIFPYWMERNILERTRKKFNNPDCMRLFERIVFFLASKAGTISHTVPAYSIVAGNPAKVVRMRFSENEISILQSIEWWNWDDSKLDSAMPYLLAGDVSALQAFSSKYDLSSEQGAESEVASRRT